MRKKALILLIITITIFLSSCSGSVYIGEPPATQEEKDANIAEYGVIAEIYYDIFEEPKDEEEVKNIMAYNGFEYKGEDYNDRRVISEQFEKKEIINGIDYKIKLKIIYENGGANANCINFDIYYSNDTFSIFVNNFFKSTGFSSEITISDDINVITISENTNEITYSGEKSDTFYQNYLNGDYDAQIEEMLTIMEEELQPLPEDYVAPNTNK